MHHTYKSLPYHWVFVWAFLLSLAFAVQPAHTSGTQRELLSVSLTYIIYILSLTRKQIVNAPGGSFWDTGMRLCDIDENGDCHTGDYALSIIRFGAGGIAAAALSLLFFIFFIPIRFLCNGFGGKNKSYGICMPLLYYFILCFLLFLSMEVFFLYKKIVIILIIFSF